MCYIFKLLIIYCLLLVSIFLLIQNFPNYNSMRGNIFYVGFVNSNNSYHYGLLTVFQTLSSTCITIHLPHNFV